MTDERQERIDDSIAKQLQRSMRRNAQMAVMLQEVLYYIETKSDVSALAPQIKFVLTGEEQPQ